MYPAGNPVTDRPFTLATQTLVPSDATAAGELNPKRGPFTTCTKAPADASSSVTELLKPGSKVSGAEKPLVRGGGRGGT